MQKELKYSSILLITSSAGGGHLKAAQAKEAEIRENYPDTKIFIRDILSHWIPMGSYFSHLWNISQGCGSLWALSLFAYNQYLADKLFWLPVFVSAYRTMVNNKIDHVVDTQPICTSAILKALRLYNKMNNKKVLMEKVITDLPTEKTTHFFSPIKNLSDNDKNYIKISSTHPLLSNRYKSDKSFWENTCNLPQEKISYKKFPIRKSFTQRNNHREVLIKTKSNSQLEYNQLIEKTSYNKKLYPYVYYNILSQDKLLVLMMGKTPHLQTIKNYVTEISTIIKLKKSGRLYHLFVFCGSEKRQKEIMKIPTSSSLSVIPLSFQNGNVISQILGRSDAAIIKAGGLTAMEILSVSFGKIWIHSYMVGKWSEKINKLLKHQMPIWERGNAEYLQEKRGALLINNDNFRSLCGDFFD